ncbi:cation:proton antiporter [Bradymonas sediminis]|uniref:Cation/H+ exchanger transmembrane domain-containing protein n=1 Tax=Bradymonas sediminis TaxID=1548548 RepID=A0A2Z4FN49_9DELT|nr:cation:proton antiporter [Bradymonas sediminis]AWV90407.1 hypothetical protein DN745_14145 [Bradymonas sediminis]TDP72207.1 Kef-type K+ transport system membrane component KefB [Bradymonas sediminis]
MSQVITIVILLALMYARQFFDFSDGSFGSMHPDSLVATGFIILAAFTMGELFKRLKVPALLGYIAAGIVFGPDLSQIVFGSTEQTIFTKDVINDLALINILTVGVIGTLGGGELKISDLKEHASTIVTVIGVVFAVVVPSSALILLGMATFFPSTAPFLMDVPTSTKLAAAMLFGVFAFAMSPTVSLAILQETRSKGPFTSLMLGTVILGDLVLVIGVLLAADFAVLVMGPTGITMAAAQEMFIKIGLEFGWAMVLGLITGLLYIGYLRFVAREKLLFTVGIIFATSAVAEMVHAETLVTFLVAGFIVQNFSKHGHDMIHSLEKISLPVFVIYFMTQAASLDLMQAVHFLPLTLVMATARVVSQVGGAKIALKLLKAPEVVRRNLPFAMLSLGSVDIVLAALVASKIPSWGGDLQAVVMGNVIIYIIVGPAVLKWVLGRAGETEEARQTGSEEVAELDRIVGDEMGDEELLEHPEFTDPRLKLRLEQVRDELTTCYKSTLVERIETHGESLQELLDRIHEVRHKAISELFELLENAGDTPTQKLGPRVKRLHVQFRQTLQPQIDLLEHIEAMPVTPQSTEKLLVDVHQLVHFEESYRVQLEPWLLEASPEDSLWMRAVKVGRRTRNFVRRGCHRTIPLGRLWRFYLELSLPGYLASAVAATAEQNEQLWQHLGLHLRRVDDLFERVVRILSSEDITVGSAQSDSDGEGDEQTPAVKVVARGRLLAPSVDALPMSMSGEPGEDEDDDEADEHDDAHAHEDDEDASGETALPEEPEEVSAPQPALSAVEAALAQARASHESLCKDAKALDAQLEVYVQSRRKRFGFSVEHAYADFIEAVGQAGTLSLPGYRYRASLRYDEAHRAQVRLQSRLGRAGDLVEGYQGWIVLDHQLILFLHWFRTYQQRVLITFQTRFEDGCVRQIKQLKLRCEDRPTDAALDDDASAQPTFDWPHWYGNKINPALENARISLDQALTDFDQGIIIRRLMDVLEARIARFSERVNLLAQNPTESLAEQSDVETVSVPLRAWYFSKLLREIALRLLESNERAERTLRRSMVALGEMRLGLETSLVSHQKELREGELQSAPDAPDLEEAQRANEVAQQGLERAITQAEELIRLIQHDEHDMRMWIIEETTKVARDSTIPFLEHRLKEVMAELEKNRGPSLARRRVRPIVNRARNAYHRVAPVIEEIRHDIYRHLNGKPAADPKIAPGRSHARARLLRSSLETPESGLKLATPAIYRRLFSPVPVDIPDFYVERPQLEQDCLDAVDRWFNGNPTAILIGGDAGMGKRTLIHHVLPIRLFSKYNEIAEEQLQMVRLDEADETERELCEAFFPLLEGSYPRTFLELGQHLSARNDRRIVFVENGDKIYSRTREGLSLSERFLTMMERSSDNILWILLMNKPAATLLDTAVQIGDYFTDSIELDALSPANIERMIMSRHKVSGFEITFLPPEVRYLQRVKHPLDTRDALKNPRQEFFRRLGKLSGGNPLLALLYWSECAHLDASDKSRILVDPLPDEEVTLTEHLSLQKKLLLATLVQHSALSAPRLSRILRLDLDEVRTELSHLRRQGFVDLVPGTNTYHMPALAGALVTRELRAENLI